MKQCIYTLFYPMSSFNYLNWSCVETNKTILVLLFRWLKYMIFARFSHLEYYDLEPDAAGGLVYCAGCNLLSQFQHNIRSATRIRKVDV
jgi:hypothetical protein